MSELMDSKRPGTELMNVERSSFGPIVPALIAEAGDGAARRFFEFCCRDAGSWSERLDGSEAKSAMPIRTWREALNRFAIVFEHRLPAQARS